MVEYNWCLTYYDYAFPDGDEAIAAMDAHRLFCLLNTALCENWLRLPHDALNHTYQAMQMVPGHAKARYRKARALRQLHRFTEARDELRLALADLPGDAELRREWVDLRTQYKAYKAHEREIGLRMFGGGGGGGDGGAADGDDDLDAASVDTPTAETPRTDDARRKGLRADSEAVVSATTRQPTDAAEFEVGELHRAVPYDAEALRAWLGEGE